MYITTEVEQALLNIGGLVLVDRWHNEIPCDRGTVIFRQNLLNSFSNNCNFTTISTNNLVVVLTELNKIHRFKEPFYEQNNRDNRSSK